MRPIGGELVTTITSPSCWGTHFLYLSNPPAGIPVPIIPCLDHTPEQQARDIYSTGYYLVPGVTISSVIRHTTKTQDTSYNVININAANHAASLLQHAPTINQFSG